VPERCHGRVARAKSGKLAQRFDGAIVVMTWIQYRLDVVRKVMLVLLYDT
jgi:hypothetical protein